MDALASEAREMFATLRSASQIGPFVGGLLAGWLVLFGCVGGVLSAPLAASLGPYMANGIVGIIVGGMVAAFVKTRHVHFKWGAAIAAAGCGALMVVLVLVA